MIKRNKKENNNTINIVIIIGIIFLITALVLMFINTDKNDNRIKIVSYNEYLDVIKEDKYSIILLTNPTCVHCNSYKPFVNYVATENNLDVYDIDVTAITEDEYIELHNKYTATKDVYQDDIPVIKTPTTIIVKNSEEITSISGDIGYNGLLKLLQKYQIIK